MFHKQNTCVHFVGIGGIGMSGIAEILMNLGYAVSGSDQRQTATTERLEALGAKVYLGHSPSHVGDVDVVVISSAVKADNPEVAAARARKIPVIPRAEMLAELMRLKYGVAVAGSHGKTTTTSLIATILYTAGLDPTAVIGGKVPLLGSNARLGAGDYLIAEADESDGSFLRLTPTVAVVTNIDPEHLDYYGSIEMLQKTFLDFLNKVPFYGLAVVCLDHPIVRTILPQLDKRVVTYGFTPLADIRAEAVSFSGLHTSFTPVIHGKTFPKVVVPLPGRHSVQNALAALAVSDFLGVEFAVYKLALENFSGVRRRFTVRGEVDDVIVVDDYGHHPVEIRATLSGARSGFPNRRIVVAFQPHRYSRTRDLFTEFVSAFQDADVVVMTDIYAAGEEPIEGVCAADLADQIRDQGHAQVCFVGERAEVAGALHGLVRAGDLVITLGAGDIGTTADVLIEKIRQSAQTLVGESA